MKESFSQHIKNQARDSERVDRMHQRHTMFMELTSTRFKEYLRENHANLAILPISDREKIADDFLRQEHPNFDNRAELVTELLGYL